MDDPGDVPSPSLKSRAKAHPEGGYDETNEHQKIKFLGNYEIMKTIGEGSFAKVKLAVHRLTKKKVEITP